MRSIVLWISLVVCCGIVGCSSKRVLVKNCNALGAYGYLECDLVD